MNVTVKRKETNSLAVPLTGIEQILLKQENNLANKLQYITVVIRKETPSLIMRPKEKLLNYLHCNLDFGY